MSGELAAEMAQTLAWLDRAHLMGCSDPTDPTKRSLYSEAAEAIRGLIAAAEEASRG